MDKTTPMKLKSLVNATCKLGKKGCFEDGRCHALGNCENKIQTNADKIRSMTDEELAELFFYSTLHDTQLFLLGKWIWRSYLLKWLQSEVEEK